jgi:FAD/FMN-containing dehydrogenase
MNQHTSGPAAGRLSRRGLLTTAAAAGAVVGGTGLAAALGGTPAAAAPPEPAAFPAVTVPPDDRRYPSLLRGNNWRFVGRPDEIRVAGSTEQVRRAVGDAVRAGRRVAVRSGGHCFENFTGDPAVRTLIDLSPMDAVGYDADRRAFAVQPGATLGHVFQTLFKGWGVTLPAGGCPEVGAGGHIAGGGYGPLSRRYGSVVDHLYGVEVVVVDADGTARTVVATREPGDPNRDLWWAHTGGGGGNFGVATRYWLRSPGATGADPSRQLPPAPRELLAAVVSWPWDGLTEAGLTTLLRNFTGWHERHSAPGVPEDALYAILLPLHRSAGVCLMSVQIDADVPGAAAMLRGFVTEINAGTGLTPTVDVTPTLPWLPLTTWPGTGEPGDATTRRYKIKAGYLRRAFTDAQLATIWRYLNDPAGSSGASMLLVGYGGQVNTVAPDATATFRRDAVLKVVYGTTWADDADDDANLAWIRAFYHDVYAATGGAPVEDGSYINYPDNDLADPAWNTSGVPWSALYYGDNYPRLQRIKARWDPRDVFRHALSIRPPA